MFWFLVTTPAFVVAVQSPSRVRLFATAWIPTRQASLSFTISWSLPKFMFIALVMPALPPCFLFFFFSLYLSQPAQITVTNTIDKVA